MLRHAFSNCNAYSYLDPQHMSSTHHITYCLQNLPQTRGLKPKCSFPQHFALGRECATIMHIKWTLTVLITSGFEEYEANRKQPPLDLEHNLQWCPVLKDIPNYKLFFLFNSNDCLTFWPSTEKHSTATKWTLQKTRQPKKLNWMQEADLIARIKQEKWTPELQQTHDLLQMCRQLIMQPVFQIFFCISSVETVFHIFNNASWATASLQATWHGSFVPWTPSSFLYDN